MQTYCSQDIYSFSSVFPLRSLRLCGALPLTLIRVYSRFAIDYTIQVKPFEPRMDANERELKPTSTPF